MASILAAVRWWDEWQMRILISGSLFIQWFLLLAAPLRMYSIRGPIRFLIMLAYGSSDALAIYALATLFNRQAQASSPCHVGYKASSIEVLWAPILLIHLGGREEITAINIEENELWTRQAVTLVSQVTIAVYSFYKTWPTSGDSRLLCSAILLFIIGILSFGEKPWAIRRASINRLVAVSSKAAGRRKKTRGCFEYTQHMLMCLCRMKKLSSPDDDDDDTSSTVLSDSDKIQMIFSDMSLLAAATDLASRQRWRPMRVLEKVAAGGERNMQKWMRMAFRLVYTRANVISTPAYIACHVLLVPCLHVAAIVLFATSDKQAYRLFNTIDIRVTYVVLCLTAVLDVFGLLISELLYKLMRWTDVPALCETLPGHNLIDAALECKKPAARRLLSWIGCDSGKVSDNKYLKVAGMVLLDLLTCRQSLMGLDLGSYRSHERGKNWALGSLETSIFETIFAEGAESQIARSLRGLPFDVSVLRWHIATDLCFRSSSPEIRRAPGDIASLHIECAAAMSDYMAHLFYSRPEMLLIGTRQHLFLEAMEDTSYILLRQLSPLDGFRVAKFIEDSTPEYPLVHEACKLAAELMELPEATRWEVMYHVWIGMLCYSASMCRGYLHAKSLGQGGEFLSFISFIIALKGAKTLPDKLQMPDHDEGATRGANNN